MYFLKVALLALVYIACGKGGLYLDAVSGFAAAVWPPTGISLFALYTFGISLWPGVFLGAFVLNLSVGAPVLVATGMGCGNTGEAVVAAYYLRRFVNFRPGLTQVRDVIGLIFIAAILCTLISASIGVLSGYLGGVIEAQRLYQAWSTWWIGDMMSNLVIAPLLFTAVAPPASWSSSRGRFEGAILSAALVSSCLIIFFFPLDGIVRLRPYLIFPFVIWAALRFGPKEVAYTVFFVSVSAILSVSLGHEPFTRHSTSEGLIAVQLFLGVLAVTGFIMAAAVAERKNSEDALADSERVLKELLSAKEILIKEVHHRVKNNLQIITSLIRLQASTVKEKVVLQLFDDTQRRVRSMALIHEQLYKAEDLTSIEMDEYIKLLGDEMASALSFDSSRISLLISADPITLGLESAIPCGLLLQELVSNCYKHAFPGDVKGEIYISLMRKYDSRIALTVRDNGIGLPADMDISRTKSLGLRIVHTLCKQLGAEINFLQNSGTVVVIHFRDKRGHPQDLSTQEVAHLGH